MRVVIFGATGGTGRRLVRRALEAGHEVTAFARSASSLDEAPGLRPSRRRRARRCAVASVMGGQDAVLISLGAPAFDRSGVRAVGTRNIVAAMKEAGGAPVVAQTVMGVRDSEPALTPVLRWLVVPLYLRRGLCRPRGAGGGARRERTRLDPARAPPPDRRSWSRPTRRASTTFVARRRS